MRQILDSLGIQYEYQLPLRSGFVLDFAFREQKKAIEVDGYYHQFTQDYDEFRDRVLERAGWKILRINADEIETSETRTLIERFLT